VNCIPMRPQGGQPLGHGCQTLFPGAIHQLAQQCDDALARSAGRTGSASASAATTAACGGAGAERHVERRAFLLVLHVQPCAALDEQPDERLALPDGDVKRQRARAVAVTILQLVVLPHRLLWHARSTLLRRRSGWRHRLGGRRSRRDSLRLRGSAASPAGGSTHVERVVDP